MIVYLAATNAKQGVVEKHKPKYVLESFYTYKKWQDAFIPSCESFMLDSGAFTYLNTKSIPSATPQALDEYVVRYAQFIKARGVKLFVEMDVDKVVGIQKVEQMRRYIERETGKQPIPVWHRSRGKDYFIGQCKDYPYIAVGGIAIKDIAKTEYKYFRWLIDTAHNYGTKIHALGFTQTQLLKSYHFDSVDSTSWISGRFGTLYTFTGTSLNQQKLDSNRRKDFKRIDDHNLREWMKYQQYAEQNL